MITLDSLQELLHYDPKTGVFSWRVGKGSAKKGAIAGAAHHTGYTVISIRRKKYLAHRLAWLYQHGRWPEGEIDHLNLIKDDNRIENLREATCRENSSNTPKRREGLKGVAWHKGARRWQASIKVAGTSHYLGLFDTEAEAHRAYCKAAEKLHGDFWRAA